MKDHRLLRIAQHPMRSTSREEMLKNAGLANFDGVGK
jgi:hypothetical protein